VKPIADMTRLELAGHVCSTLKENNIDAVLTGGSCASIYSQEKYVSYDLDFIDMDVFSDRGKIETVMESLGFCKHSRYFKHPDTELFVEFPAGPLAIGEEPVKKVDEIETEMGILRILSPTDCVKDRLSWYYHDGDLQSLDQAILVAHKNEIDLNEIQRWSKVEGKLREFKNIENKLR